MLSAIPPLSAPITAAQTGADAAKSYVGEQKYEEYRGDALSWGGLSAGLIPVLPPLWPIQIGLFVFLIIMFLMMGISGGKATLLAYLGQAVCIMVMWKWLADKFLRYGVGV